MTRFKPLSKDPEEIARMWYVPPRPQHRAGWLLYSEEFVLRTLQDCHDRPDDVRRTHGWRILARFILALMALCQLLLTALSHLPVMGGFMYMLARGFPRNAVGFFLRSCYWKAKLRRLGVDTLIDQDVEIRRPRRVEIGSHCHIDHAVLLSVGSGDGSIVIGDYVFIGPSCHIAGRGGVEIRDFAALAARVHIYSVTNSPFHPERMGELISMSHMAPAHQQYTVESPVRVGEYAVIGYGTLILPGVTLGRGVIVHPQAELRTTFPDFAVLSGHGRARQQGWRRPGKLDPRATD